MTLLSSTDKARIEAEFTKLSGLERDQFAMSSWSFPVIPIPVHRQVAKGVFREAPTNISREFLGHPIYWIDHELTKYDPQEETEDAWAIRMYHLILAFDLWDSTPEGIRWVNVLDNKGVDVDDTSFSVYTQSRNNEFSSVKCKLDNLQRLGFPLNDNTMVMAWSKVETTYLAVLEECDRRLQSKIGVFFEQQNQALKNAWLYMGRESNLSDPNLSAISATGWWMENVAYELDDIDKEYQDAFRAGRSKAAVGAKAVALAEHLQYHLLIMAQTIGVLSIPIVRHSVTMSQAYSEMMTYLKVAAYKAAATDYMSNYQDIVDRLINIEQVDSGYEDAIPTMLELMEAMYHDYATSWCRLRLTVANYNQLAESLPPFPSYQDLLSYLGAVWEDRRIDRQLESDTEMDRVSDDLDSSTPQPVDLKYVEESLDIDVPDDIGLDNLDISDLDISLDN